MFSLSPPERKALIVIASIIFLGTLIRHFNLEVREVVPSSVSVEEKPPTININKASAGGLQKLVGIGPVLSQRIIEYRQEHGPFKEIADLEKVKGIGKHKAEAIKKHIEF